MMCYKLFILALLGSFTIISGHHDGHDHDHDDSSKKVVYVEVGEHCDLASAPKEDGTSWHVVEHDVEKVCAPGSSCRGGACNCDDLADGTKMGISQDNDGTRVCRRLSGEKCSADEECFKNVLCTGGVCTCPQDVHCQTTKNDVYILDK